MNVAWESASQAAASRAGRRLEQRGTV